MGELAKAQSKQVAVDDNDYNTAPTTDFIPVDVDPEEVPFE